MGVLPAEERVAVLARRIIAESTKRSNSVCLLADHPLKLPKSQPFTDS